jgi:hypothetical protein
MAGWSLVSSEWLCSDLQPFEIEFQTIDQITSDAHAHQDINASMTSYSIQSSPSTNQILAF